MNTNCELQYLSKNSQINMINLYTVLIKTLQITFSSQQSNLN